VFATDLILAVDSSTATIVISPGGGGGPEAPRSYPRPPTVHSRAVMSDGALIPHPCERDGSFHTYLCQAEWVEEVHTRGKGDRRTCSRSA
jgi:hypothetical protein